MGGAKLLKWRLAAEGAKLLKSGAALILRTPGCLPWCMDQCEVPLGRCALARERGTLV